MIRFPREIQLGKHNGREEERNVDETLVAKPKPRVAQEAQGAEDSGGSTCGRLEKEVLAWIVRITGV